jgi:hypothetical protein
MIAGSVLHRKGAHKLSVYADIVGIVREAFQRSSSKSAHRSSRELKTPFSTVQKFYTVCNAALIDNPDFAGLLT